MDAPKEFALIVAAGSGTRFHSDVPKQFLELNGLPIVMHTLRAFRRYSDDLQLILVLAREHKNLWSHLVQKHQFEITTKIAEGGTTRYQSVRNGLTLIDDDKGLVAIHDGVRPLVQPEIIRASFSLASVHGSAVAAVRLKESIRLTDKDRTRTVDRSQYRMIQTPQTFQVGLIKKGYALPEDPAITDDAGAAERTGHAVSLFEGSYENIKITTPGDLVMAEALLKSSGI